MPIKSVTFTSPDGTTKTTTHRALRAERAIARAIGRQFKIGGRFVPDPGHEVEGKVYRGHFTGKIVDREGNLIAPSVEVEVELAR